MTTTANTNFQKQQGREDLPTIFFTMSTITLSTEKLLVLLLVAGYIENILFVIIGDAWRKIRRDRRRKQKAKMKYAV